MMMDGKLANTMFDMVVESTADGVIRIEEVRVGYFSTCARLQPGGWHCGITTAEAQVFAEVPDPLGLVDVAHRFRTEVINPGLM